jgi:probable HAF family extracellular repeat protein
MMHRSKRRPLFSIFGLVLSVMILLTLVRSRPVAAQVTMTDLGTLPGGQSSIAVGINNAGQIVGQSQTATGQFHPVLWENGTITDLGTLGGTVGVANSINVAGQIVGQNQTAAGELHAFLWENGTMAELGG